MKNTLLFLCMSLIFTGNALAQKKSKDKSSQLTIPENVNNSFKSLYANAEGNKWNRNYSGNYVASFMNADSLKQTAEFSASGAMVKSRTEYAPTSLPAPISMAVNTQYPEAKLLEASRLQMPGVAPYYRLKVETAEHATKELLVSEEGTITE